MKASELFSLFAGANAYTSGSVSLEKIIESINQLNLPPVINPFEISPLTYSFDEEPKPEPKLRIRDSVPMIDEYRAEINQWLLDMYGRHEKFEPHTKLLISQAMGLGPFFKYPEAVMLHTAA